MTPSATEQLSLRLNPGAVASLLLLAAAVGAFATHPPLSGLEPAYGPLVDSAVAPLATALGHALWPLLLAWLVLTMLYIRRVAALRFAAQAFGWLLLVAITAVVLDRCGTYLTGAYPHQPGTIGHQSATYGHQPETLGHQPATHSQQTGIFGQQSGTYGHLPGSLGHQPVAYGHAGSLGAFLNFTLTDHFSPLAIGLLLVLAMVLAFALIAPRWLRAACCGLAWLGRSGRKLFGRFRRPRHEVVPLKLADAPVPLEQVDATFRPIPIHKPSPAVPPIHNLVDQSGVDTLPDTIAPTNYELPPLSLLADPDPHPAADQEHLLRERASLLEKTFADFGLNVNVVGIHTGPVITQYEVGLETGLRLNKVTSLADDVALNLKVPAVRMVAPLPGRNTVGIEVPNEHRQRVRLKELILATQAKAAKFKLPIFMGKDVEGRPLVYDLAAMPHLLIAGRTGTGKSVCLNAIILSLLYSRTPDECRLILIDPKMVELSEYGRVPHLMHPVVTKPEKAEAILAWAVDKMEERYSWLSRARVRNIAAYNELGFDEIIHRIDPQSEDERQQVPRHFPYIVMMIDEVGDLLMSMKKEVENHIIRLAQKSRAAGIHVILATQKPTVDVITGLIKSNMPARICFQVASRADSMVVLDEKGADKLLGMGDMLFLQPASSTILRAQGAFVDDQEIERTVAHLQTDEPNFESELLNLKVKSKAEGSGSGTGDLSEQLRRRDELYEQAIEVVVREQRGSTSLLQRALGIGYGRASRLIDFMAEDGIVGPYNGSNARDVLIAPEEWQARKAAV